MYNFTTKWFNNTAKTNWEKFIPALRPFKILEIGSFEGASTCFLIERLSGFQEIEIHCIDTWEGGMEHKRDNYDMAAAERNFDSNIEYAISKTLYKPIIYKWKEYSESALMKLFLEGKRNYFDFIYIDGSHATVDVLSDAVLAFKLLKPKGFLCFDDYAWTDKRDIDYFPKLAIDAFTTIYSNKMKFLISTNVQIWITKTEE